MKEYIEREVALEILKRNPIGTWRGAPVYSEEIKSAMAEIGDLPAADVAEVVHAKWNILNECLNEGVYCSRCKKKVYKIEYANQKLNSKYCPNCGAKMDDDFCIRGDCG